jgi:putative oxidoreductase
MVMHGAQKLFMFGYGGAVGAFTQMGIPAPSLSAGLVIGAEFLGGIALLLGLFTRLAALPVAATMLGALVMVHLKAGYFLPNGIEFVLTLFASAVALVLTGPGALALDNLRGRARAEREGALSRTGRAAA